MVGWGGEEAHSVLNPADECRATSPGADDLDDESPPLASRVLIHTAGRLEFMRRASDSLGREMHSRSFR